MEREKQLLLHNLSYRFFCLKVKNINNYIYLFLPDDGYNDAAS